MKGVLFALLVAVTLALLLVAKANYNGWPRLKETLIKAFPAVLLRKTAGNAFLSVSLTIPGMPALPAVRPRALPPSAASRHSFS